MAHQLTVLGAAAIALASVTGFATQAQESEPDASAQVAMSAQEIVAARRASYFLSTQAVGQIKAGIAEGGDLRRTVTAAKMLANWAQVLPTMFPEGTNIEGSRALDTVWSDRAGFDARAAAYRDAALELARVAESGDRAASDAAFKAMAGTCHACHEAYREE